MWLYVNKKDRSTIIEWDNTNIKTKVRLVWVFLRLESARSFLELYQNLQYVIFSRSKQNHLFSKNKTVEYVIRCQEFYCWLGPTATNHWYSGVCVESQNRQETIQRKIKNFDKSQDIVKLILIYFNQDETNDEEEETRDDFYTIYPQLNTSNIFKNKHQKRYF